MSLPPRRLTQDHLARLLELLQEEGRTVLGPRAERGAVGLAGVSRLEDLPRGLDAETSPGSYRLVEKEGAALFGHPVGQDSWKRHLHVPEETLLSVQADGTGSFRVAEPEPRAEETALFGVRACDLRAIHVQDRVLLQGPHPDPHYQARREAALLVAVECTRSAETCFCAAVGGGPGVSDACDLVLTEMVEGGGPPWYLARAGSPRGDDLLSRLEAPFAGEEERRQAAAAVRAAGESQERDLPPGDLRKLFYPNHDNQLWHALAQRCLVCGNCTLVCPTCFCTEVSDHAGPGGERVERRRRWESCYTREFSHLPGGAVRQSASSRHRHWVVHKLAAWRDHFGELGCVGCGRCIVWCPAGIDLTQEAWAMQKADQREPEHA